MVNEWLALILVLLAMSQPHVHVNGVHAPTHIVAWMLPAQQLCTVFHRTMSKVVRMACKGHLYSTAGLVSAMQMYLSVAQLHCRYCTSCMHTVS